MELLDIKNIDELVEGHLPSMMSLDEYHPSNDPHQKTALSIRNQIVAAQAPLSPLQVKGIKMYAKGEKVANIAIECRTTPQTIRTWLKKPETLKLLALLKHLDIQATGASVEVRKGMLWRIAVDNEKVRPNMTLNAIDTLNKMDDTYAAPNQQPNAAVQITINQTLMPQGRLDDLPETYESRIAKQPVVIEHDGE